MDQAVRRCRRSALPPVALPLAPMTPGADSVALVGTASWYRDGTFCADDTVTDVSQRRDGPPRRGPS
jgi:hypothetical protein